MNLTFLPTNLWSSTVICNFQFAFSNGHKLNQTWKHKAAQKAAHIIMLHGLWRAGPELSVLLSSCPACTVHIWQPQLSQKAHPEDLSHRLLTQREETSTWPSFKFFLLCRHHLCPISQTLSSFQQSFPFPFVRWPVEVTMPLVAVTRLYWWWESVFWLFVTVWRLGTLRS